VTDAGARRRKKPAGLGVLVLHSGWQVAYGYRKPLEQPFSQRRTSVSSESQYRMRSSIVLDCRALP